MKINLGYENPTTNLCDWVIIQTLQASRALEQLRLAIARAGSVITFLPISHVGVDVVGELGRGVKEIIVEAPELFKRKARKTRSANRVAWFDRPFAPRLCECKLDSA